MWIYLPYSDRLLLSYGLIRCQVLCRLEQNNCRLRIFQQRDAFRLLCIFRLKGQPQGIHIRFCLLPPQKRDKHQAPQSVRHFFLFSRNYQI